MDTTSPVDGTIPAEINLTVKHYKSAAPFLLKQHRQFIPDMDTTSPVDGTIPELQDRKSSTPSTSKPVPVLDSPCSVASDGSSTNWNGIPRVRRKWVDVVEVPLL